ncbi:MAG: slipin family protein [Alphaproteobacteria bacterium]|nr:slipin family protein [Alphaproteobacteria bacterium]
MKRPLLIFEAIVRDDERGLLSRNGKFERLVEPGVFRAFDPGNRVSLEIVKVVRTEMPVERMLLLARAKPEVERAFTLVRTGPSEVAIVSFDGEPRHVVTPNMARAFWSVVTDVTVERIDTSAELRVSRKHLDMVNASATPSIVSALVEPYEAALLIVDGEVKERLSPGQHAFWGVKRTVRIAKMDMRPTPLEVTAQEILTKDRIAIRVTLTAFYRITAPETAAVAAADLANTIYRLVQFAIREAVAARTLDDILAARDSIDSEVRAFVRERVAALGAEIGDIGVKDVILPGDIRDLLNKVVEAERVAKANLIRRQEETAATRSLLNTAKMMDDNPLLLRLKELEALERLVEKVGRIDLHAGQSGGLQALLSDLYRLRGPDGDQA